MSPTLQSGDVVFVSPLPYLFVKPKLGDIVICLDPRDKRTLVKRVAAVKQGKYFVTGDNPDASTDSKAFGNLNKKDIKGKVIWKLR